MGKQLAPTLFVILLVALTGCGSGILGTPSSMTPVTPPPSGSSIWVGAWGNSPADAGASDSNPGGSEQSFRFLVHPTVSGTQERVRFSNFFGQTPVTIGAARLSIGKDRTAAIDATHDVKVTFNNGSSSVTLQPGQIIVSDPVNLTYTYGQTLAVSVYLSGTFNPLTHHDSLFPNNFSTPSGAGNKTTDTTGSSFTNTTTQWLLLNGIDVYGPYQGTVVLFGTSTTEGVHSDFGSTNTYPTPNVPVPGQYSSRPADWLAKRLNAGGYQIGVIDAGISGSTVLQDAASNAQIALDRINRDVLQQPNVVAMVMYFGAIDLRSSVCKSASDIEAADQRVIAAAAAAKVRVILATLPPSAFCTNPAAANYGPSPTPTDPYAGGANPGPVNPAETQRMTLDSWIRSTGSTLPGVVAIVDYDKALADPARPNFLLPPYNSGDNYHPTGAGYQAEINVVPLNLLLPPSN